MNVDVLWANFLTQIKEELTSLAYDTWFNDTKLHELVDGKAIIIVPMQIHKKHLADKYSLLIKDKLNNITGTNFELEFLLENEVQKNEVKDINYRKTALKNIMEIEEWCKEQFDGKPEYSRRTPRTDIKGIKTAKEERELGLGKALSNFKQSTIWKNYQEGKEKGLSLEKIKQEYGMREGEIALVERYERIIEEYDVKKKITGQSIGQVSYTATVQECDEAQADLNKLLDKQKNQQEV